MSTRPTPEIFISYSRIIPIMHNEAVKTETFAAIEPTVEPTLGMETLEPPPEVTYLPSGG